MSSMRLVRVAGLACICAAALAGQDSGTRARQWVDYYTSAYRVPPELVHAIVEIESGWRPDAMSPKGAVGLMQLRPATAAAFGVRDRYDVRQNIRGGVAYLAHLMRRFQGELRLVAAAYFAGERRIAARRLRYSKPEVFHYVRRVGELYRSKRLGTRRTSNGSRGKR